MGTQDGDEDPKRFELYLDEVSREPIPQFEDNEEVYSLNSSQETKGVVLGPSRTHKDLVTVKFKDPSTDVPVIAHMNPFWMSHPRPNNIPLPDGYKVGQSVFYTSNEEQIEGIKHLRQNMRGTVIGPSPHNKYDEFTTYNHRSYKSEQKQKTLSESDLVVKLQGKIPTRGWSQTKIHVRFETGGMWHVSLENLDPFGPGFRNKRSTMTRRHSLQTPRSSPGTGRQRSTTLWRSDQTGTGPI